MENPQRRKKSPYFVSMNVSCIFQFDSLVQTATGFNHEEGKAYYDYLSSHPEAGNDTPSLMPRPFPVQVLDHTAGYLLAFGIHVALAKTITVRLNISSFRCLPTLNSQEGGSWEVQVSLAAVGQWLRSLGRLLPEEAFGKENSPLPSRTDDEIRQLSVTWPTVNGQSTVTAMRHPTILSGTPVREGASGSAPMVLNAHQARW